jgi:DnaJ-class molecular chaperone
LSKKPIEKEKTTADLILEKIEALEKRLDEEKAAKAAEETHVHHDSPSPIQTAVQPQQEPKKQPESGLDHYRNCPTCHKEINAEAKKELEPEIIKDATQKIREKVKSFKEPVVCTDCGEVNEFNKEPCTSCGSTNKARKFRY